MRLIILSIILVCASCGIPDFPEPLKAPEYESDTANERYKLLLNYNQSDVDRTFQLYARYYLNSSTSAHFDEDDYKDVSSGNAEGYLKSKGFVQVEYLNNEDNDNYEELTFSDTSITLYIKFFQDISGQDQSVKILLKDELVEEDDDDQYFIVINKEVDDTEIEHKIGDRSNRDNYVAVIKTFTGNESEITNKINIEFAIITKSVNMTTSVPDNLSSDPVYIGYFELKI